ncbi:MAG: hypothetical protein M4579_007409, partial [Chaenotheca gracillima]
MHFSSTLSHFLSVALVIALPQSGDSPSSSLDINNPSAADPTAPPISLSVPSPIANPWASGGIPLVPTECTDASNPSAPCFTALSKDAEDGVHAFGGYLTHDGSCSPEKKGQLETAAWDACNLATHASTWPANFRGEQAGQFYLGPDYISQQERIQNNIRRAADFKVKTNSYITTSCKDTKNYCNIRRGGKAVGGYGWTYKGILGSYHYITLCPPFFTVETLETQVKARREELARGDTSRVTDMRYLQTTGQYFLHEMMHTDLIGKPHITDEKIGDGPRGIAWAYGPALVHESAQFDLALGGGAKRASTNADSYAMLANALYWWDVTDYFPGVPGKNHLTEDPRDAIIDESPIPLYYVDLGEMAGVGSVDFASLFDEQSSGFGSANVSASPSPPETTIKSKSTPKPTPKPTPPPVADSCDVSYKFLYDQFEIRGENFDPKKFGTDGSGLESQIKGCGALTDWHFELTTGSPPYQ